MITEEENIVSSRASHSFVDKQTVPLLQSFHPRKMPSDYDYDYSSIFRTMNKNKFFSDLFGRFENNHYLCAHD